LSRDQITVVSAPTVFTSSELAELRASWSLDQTRAHLNHGSYGAVPIIVDAAAAELRARLNANPMEFFGRFAHTAIDEACASVADFLRGDADGLTFVTNATAAMSIVLFSAGLSPGDEVIVTDHAYGAIRFAVDRYCADVGARVVEVTVPLEATADEVNALVLAAVTSRTTMAVVDHITSPTARLFDVAGLGASLRERGVSLVVDGAHAPSTLDIDLRALAGSGVSVWFGNLHKWACAPAGTAVLYADEAWRAKMRAPVVSWSEAAGYPASMRMQGTQDVIGWLVAPVAIGFHQAWGYDRVRAYGRELVAAGAAVIAHAIGDPAPGGDPLPLRLVPLPVGTDLAAFHQRAREIVPAEVALTSHAGRGAIRLSAHLYNQLEDYQKLADAIPALLGR
jgi:isopenicillin-N epimerase